MRTVLTALVLLAVSGAPARAAVELHAHLFMKEGMGWMFHGGFFGALEATSWKDRFSSQANPEAMKASGLKIAVAALYANPLLVWDLRASVRRQVDLAQRFVKENPDWVLAHDPTEARAALKAGKRVLLLALEGASGILETEDDLREFVDRDGIRIVTFLHLTDDRFGGVAFLKGMQAWADPWAFLKSLFSPKRDDDGVRVNPAGLTSEGHSMADQLVAHHVWIDLAHASDASTRELLPLLRAAGQPILYTHTVLRRFLGAERGITAEELQAVRESKGMVGVMPSEDMLEGTSADGGLPALAAQAREIALVVGADGVAMGTDYNGGVRHLHAAQGTGTSLDGEKGFWQIGQASDLETALGKSMPRASDDAIVERFLSGWERVFGARN